MQRLRPLCYASIASSRRGSPDRHLATPLRLLFSPFWLRMGEISFIASWNWNWTPVSTPTRSSLMPKRSSTGSSARCMSWRASSGAGISPSRPCPPMMPKAGGSPFSRSWAGSPWTTGNPKTS